jgi:hypothetical protein
MNDYLIRRLAADRRAVLVAGAQHRAQVRDARAARRAAAEDRPLPRLRVRVPRFLARRAAGTTA